MVMAFVGRFSTAFSHKGHFDPRERESEPKQIAGQNIRTKEERIDSHTTFRLKNKKFKESKEINK